jgi:hypothetical protein
MKKFSKSQERNRCESIEGSNTCILAGILKKPSKYKLKHQRSVRFEDPPTSNQESNFSLTSSYMEVVNTSPSSTLNTSPSKTGFSNTSPVKFVQFPSNFSKNYEEDSGKTPLKIIKIAKNGKKFDFKGSPKSGQKVLKFDCRDEKFYNKLNFFLNAKGSVSPVRSEFRNEEKTSMKVRLERKKDCEDANNSKTGCKKKGKIVSNLGKSGNYLLN